MRILWRSGPWLMALGVVWTGCSQPVHPPAKRSSASATRMEALPGASEVVLTVEGMS